MADGPEESVTHDTVDETLADRLNKGVNVDQDNGRSSLSTSKQSSGSNSSSCENRSSLKENRLRNSTEKDVEDLENEPEKSNCDTSKNEMLWEDDSETENMNSENNNTGNSETNENVKENSDSSVNTECNVDGYSSVNTECNVDVKVNSDDTKAENFTEKEGGDDHVLQGDNHTDTEGDNEGEVSDLSEESGSDAEYESAEEGEEIQVDKQNLRELEDTLTDEQKEERRSSAQMLKDEGNELFRCGSYKSAIRTYSRALRTCPLKYPKDRAIMYSNRAACKMRLEDFEESIRDCSKALDLHPHYMKALMRRAEIYEKTDKLDEALADYQKILELDPSQHAARAACMKLPDQIKERNEKLKEEMMSKLKDLGNMVLRPFGLSTNNFQMNQDPNSGGYSVNFVQNPQQN